MTWADVTRLVVGVILLLCATAPGVGKHGEAARWRTNIIVAAGGVWLVVVAFT